MHHARELALVALTAFGLTACAAGASVTPPDDDPDPLRRVSTAVVGYPGQDAVVVEGRAGMIGDLLALGVLYGFTARLDLDLLDPADIPASLLAPPGLQNCVATVTPENLRVAEFVNITSSDASLVIQLRNRPPDAEIVGTVAYGFMLANVAGSISATCSVGIIELDVDIALQSGWNLVGQRITEYEMGVVERAESFSLDALPEEATWYVLP